MQRAAFPDLRMDAEDVIAGGDKVVTRVRYTGTNKGAFMGMPATGKSVDVQLIDIMRFGDDGRVHEHWGVMDQMTLMQQLGLVPAPPSA
jgi:predicted ester cyclase